MVKGRRVISSRFHEADALSIKFSCENNRQEAKNSVMDLWVASTIVIYLAGNNPVKSSKTRKSSCVNARGIPPAV